MKNLWKLIAPFWFSKEKYRAFALLFSVIVITLANVYFLVVFNQWNVDFYNALQNLDKEKFFHESIRWIGIVFILISLFLANFYSLSTLQFRWRKWLTEHYITRWLQFSAHYRLKLEPTPGVNENPDQRISQDLASFTTETLDLATKFFGEGISLVTFMGILWSISGPLQFNLFGKEFYVQGYMVWAVLIYSVFGTLITFKIGKPLVGLDFQQEKYEANFRYSLVRLREKGEEIAIYKGEEVEEKNFKLFFRDIIINFYKILKCRMYLNSFINFYNNASLMFPIVAAAPMFFAKMITFGVMMQIVQAFRQVKDSLSILVDNFRTIASLRATTQRLVEFSEALSKLEQKTNKSQFFEHGNSFTSFPLNTDQPYYDIRYIPESRNYLEIKNLSLTTPVGALLINNFNLKVAAGDKVLITGKSGFGKTTLLRAISGVWPFGRGSIHIPSSVKLMFVPQRPYLPLGNLADALSYPHKSDASFDFEQLLLVLKLCRLEHLYPYLNDVQDWSLSLSIGEQQRLIFARALLHKPDWLIMDEPTASMDKETETLVYNAIQTYLPGVTLITISHSYNLRKYHDHIIDLEQSNLDNLSERELSVSSELSFQNI